MGVSSFIARASLQHGQSSRFPRSCWQGARPDAQGGEDGEEEGDGWPGQEEAAVQQAICERGCWYGQEEGSEHAAARQVRLEASRCLEQTRPGATNLQELQAAM